MRDWQHPAQLRLALEELVAHHLSLQRFAPRRKLPRSGDKGDGSLIAPFLKACPFNPPTTERVIGEILADMGNHLPC